MKCGDLFARCESHDLGEDGNILLQLSMIFYKVILGNQKSGFSKSYPRASTILFQVSKSLRLVLSTALKEEISFVWTLSVNVFFRVAIIVATFGVDQFFSSTAIAAFIALRLDTERNGIVTSASIALRFCPIEPHHCRLFAIRLNPSICPV